MTRWALDVDMLPSTLAQDRALPIPSGIHINGIELERFDAEFEISSPHLEIEWHSPGEGVETHVSLFGNSVDEALGNIAVEEDGFAVPGRYLERPGYLSVKIEHSTCSPPWIEAVPESRDCQTTAMKIDFILP